MNTQIIELIQLTATTAGLTVENLKTSTDRCNFEADGFTVFVDYITSPSGELIALQPSLVAENAKNIHDSTDWHGFQSSSDSSELLKSFERVAQKIQTLNAKGLDAKLKKLQAFSKKVKTITLH